MLDKQTAQVCAIQVQVNTGLLCVLFIDLFELLLKCFQFSLVFLLGSCPGMLNFNHTSMLLFEDLSCRALLFSRLDDFTFAPLLDPLEIHGFSLGLLLSLLFRPLHPVLAIFFNCLDFLDRTLLRILFTLVLMLLAGLLNLIMAFFSVLRKNFLPSLTLLLQEFKLLLLLVMSQFLSLLVLSPLSLDQVLEGLSLLPLESLGLSQLFQTLLVNGAKLSLGILLCLLLCSLLWLFSLLDLALLAHFLVSKVCIKFLSSLCFFACGTLLLFILFLFVSFLFVSFLCISFSGLFLFSRATVVVFPFGAVIGKFFGHFFDFLILAGAGFSFFLVLAGVILCYGLG